MAWLCFHVGRCTWKPGTACVMFLSSLQNIICFIILKVTLKQLARQLREFFFEIDSIQSCLKYWLFESGMCCIEVHYNNHWMTQPEVTVRNFGWKLVYVQLTLTNSVNWLNSAESPLNLKNLIIFALVGK